MVARVALYAGTFAIYQPGSSLPIFMYAHGALEMWSSMPVQLPDWMLDPRFLTSLLLGLVGATAAMITIYKTIKERQIGSLKTTTELLSKKKEELVAVISREMKIKYLASELMATDDSLRELITRRTKISDEALGTIDVASRPSVSQSELAQLRQLLQVRDHPVRGEILSTGDYAILALLLSLGTFIPFGNMIAFAAIALYITLVMQRQRRRFESTIKSLGGTRAGES